MMAYNNIQFEVHCRLTFLTTLKHPPKRSQAIITDLCFYVKQNIICISISNVSSHASFLSLFLFCILRTNVITSPNAIFSFSSNSHL